MACLFRFKFYLRRTNLGLGTSCGPPFSIRKKLHHHMLFLYWSVLSTGRWLLPSCQLSPLHPKLRDIWSPTNQSPNPWPHTNKPHFQISLKLLACIIGKKRHKRFKTSRQKTTAPYEFINTWFLTFLLTAAGPSMVVFGNTKLSNVLVVLVYLLIVKTTREFRDRENVTARIGI